MPRTHGRATSPGATLVNVVGKLRDEGPREAFKRALRRAYQHLDVAELDFPILPRDVSDSWGLTLPVPPPRRVEGPLRVGWLCTPPAAGSGGHTTMFRMVRALEEAGHQNVVLLYDRHHGDARTQAAVIAQSWAWVRPEVRSLDQGFADLDVVVATAWETAHVLATRTRTEPIHRAYFIQDYEPLFYPHGSVNALAADSYRLGHANITLGHMVRDHVTALGVPAHLLPFSCDTTVYRKHSTGDRSGVVFYARPDVPRRGYRLGALALQEFHRRFPDQEIHTYGAHAADLGVPVTDHGRPTPEGLNDIYNQVCAGLALSFTNISLVAEEMLAAGCIPVVNDSADARADIHSPYVHWATPTPGSLAEALGREVSLATDARATLAAASVRSDNWCEAGRGMVRVLEQLVENPPASGRVPEDEYVGMSQTSGVAGG